MRPDVLTLALVAWAAQPAHAATVDTVRLDPGDPGVCITLDGFRPCDGIETIGKFDCPRVGPSWKNAEDRVERETRCAPASDDAIYVTDEPGGRWLKTPAAGGGINLRPSLWRVKALDVVPGWSGSVCAPCFHSAPPADPAPLPPIPLPATGWLLALGLAMLLIRGRALK